MAVSIDQQFIEYIIKSIVGNPEAVKVERRIDEKGVLLELSVDPEDLGRVIGKRGATAQSLRTLLRALGTKNDARYNLKIVDTDGGGGKPSRQTRADDADDSTSKSDDTTDDDQTVTEELDAEHKDDRTQSENEDAKERLEEEPAPEDDIDVEEPADTDHSSVIDRTRKELADLDDLDI